jgi:hypothetical protein
MKLMKYSWLSCGIYLTINILSMLKAEETSPFYASAIPMTVFGWRRQLAGG